MSHLFRYLIRFYQLALSPLIGPACRYEPGCSSYMDECVRRYGAWRGGWMGAARLCRCHPWGAAGYDPVPDELPSCARWYKPWRYGRWTGRHMTIRCDRIS